VLAPVDYLALPYTALSGFVFFAEVPTVAVWAGAALIVPACLIVTGLRK
jgi:drug/metabolite transporter (DMT)-like permease